MDHTLVDVKKLKTLEDLAVFLSTGLISLNTLYNTQVRAIESGMMKEDMNERANTIAWDLRRLVRHYGEQIAAVLELLPDDFNPTEAMNNMLKVKTKKPKKKSDAQEGPAAKL